MGPSKLLLLRGRDGGERPAACLVKTATMEGLLPAYRDKCSEAEELTCNVGEFISVMESEA